MKRVFWLALSLVLMLIVGYGVGYFWHEAPRGKEYGAAEFNPRMPAASLISDPDKNFLLPPGALPSTFRTKAGVEWEQLKAMVQGHPGFEAGHDVFWQSVALATMSDEGLHPDNVREIKSAFDRAVNEEDAVFTLLLPQDHWLEYPIISGSTTLNSHELMEYGPAMIKIPEGLEVYVTPPVKMLSGEYWGKPICLVIAKRSLHVSIIKPLTAVAK